VSSDLEIIPRPTAACRRRCLITLSSSPVIVIIVISSLSDILVQSCYPPCCTVVVFCPAAPHIVVKAVHSWRARVGTCPPYIGHVVGSWDFQKFEGFCIGRLGWCGVVVRWVGRRGVSRLRNELVFFNQCSMFYCLENAFVSCSCL